MDPQSTSDGQLYAPVRFKEIVEECYHISKHTNTSYKDLMTITPTERLYLLHFIKEDIEHKNKIIQEQIQNNS